MHLLCTYHAPDYIQVRLLVYANSFLADPEAAAPPGTETVTAARWRRSLFAEAEVAQAEAGDDSALHVIVFDEIDANALPVPAAVEETPDEPAVPTDD